MGTFDITSNTLLYLTVTIFFFSTVRFESTFSTTERIKELNGETSDSLQTKLVNATTQLIKELGEGTEFHLSLNPPAYAKEQAGQLVIDYKKMETLKPVEVHKEIEPAKKEPSTDAQ